jgi:hypothetical protein
VRRFRTLGIVLGLIACLPLQGLARGAADEPRQLAARSAEEVFEKRILPIFKSPNPSSCTQCHLGGVDLKDYILPSHEKTFRSLRDQGLIDLKAPRQSKILKLISMAEGRTDGAALIHAKTRAAELEAFTAWIEACSKDPKLVEAPPLDPAERAGPARPVEVVRHGRKDRLLESFEKNVWAYRFRCMSCHAEGSPECEKHRKEHGDRVAWMKKDGAEATLNYLIRETKLINPEMPERSTLLLKPLMEVKHGGGKKFVPGDLGYKGFRTWIEDYASIVKGSYRTAENLPKTDTRVVQFGSDIWLKLDKTPSEWGDQLLVARVFAWDAAKKAWEPDPVATTDRVVWGKGQQWQHNLTLLAARDSERARAWKTGRVSLPAGRYLVKVYTDPDGKLARDWKAELGPEAYAGQAEFEARWAPGYGAMTVIDARRVRK